LEIDTILSGTLSYDISTSQDWITVDPEEGDITTELDTIKVILERTGLSESKIVEEINILSYVSEGTQLEKVDVWANGVADDDGNYYGVVTIGTQTWFAQNLNAGNQIQDGVDTEQTDNEIIEKYCYENLPKNCDTYGGMYSWYEMMNYDRAEGTPKSYDQIDGVEYMSQGICPDGWHIPTLSEWETLLLYLGQPPGGAGGKMKARGTLEDGTGLWLAPNTAATNESGFTGLPAGDIVNDKHWRMDEWAIFWTTFQSETGGITYSMTWSLNHIGNAVVGTTDSPDDLSALSVRCIMDQ